MAYSLESLRKSRASEVGSIALVTEDGSDAEIPHTTSDALGCYDEHSRAFVSWSEWVRLNRNKKLENSKINREELVSNITTSTKRTGKPKPSNRYGSHDAALLDFTNKT